MVFQRLFFLQTGGLSLLLAIALLLIVGGGPAVARENVITHAQRESNDETEKNVAPRVGPPGTTFSFYATGFHSREKVGYWFNAPDGKVYANSFRYVVHTHEGRADWNWTVPEDAPTGFWTAVVHGTYSNHQAVIAFQVANPDGGDSSSETELLVPPGSAPVVLPDYAPTNPPGVAVQPPAGSPGTRFAFFATGFKPGEDIYFWASAPGGRNYGSAHYRGKANGNGRADWNWRSPNDAMHGVWIMVGKGVESRIEQVIYFTIENPTYAPPDVAEGTPGVAVEPGAGPPTTRFAFFATGFRSREKVEFWAIDPDGREYRASKQEVRTNENGRADWQWKAPPDAAPGQWLMVARGERSGVQRTITFRVEP